MCPQDSPKWGENDESTGAFKELTRTVTRTTNLEQRTGMAYPCICGRAFSTQKGMKIHKTKKGCVGLLSDDKQRTVITGKTLEDLSQDSIHRAENIQVEPSDNELTDFLDGKRESIKFPPANPKAIWENIDKTLSI